MAMQKKEKTGAAAAGTAGVVGGGAAVPEAAPVTFGLFLLPSGRPGRRFAGAADDGPAAVEVVLLLFLLPRGRPRPRGATGDPRFRREPPASAMEARARFREKP
jgi:hypothetical protein